MTCYLILLCLLSVAIVKVVAKEISFRNVTLVDVQTREKIATIVEDSSIRPYLPESPTRDVAVAGKISVLYEDSITDITSIQNLHLIRNEIGEIRPGAFKNFSGVQALHISYSNLTVIRRATFNDLTIRELIVLFNRKLETIEEGALDNPHIETLILNYNALRDLPKNIFQKMPKLRHLHVSANYLTTIRPEFVVPNLVSAYFAYNRLAKIPKGIFTNHRTLQEVDVSENQISAIDPEAFHDVPQLKNLSLGINKLTKIDGRWFCNAPNLQRVLLVRNFISEIPEEAFGNIRNDRLEVIDLEENKIRKISADAFKGLKRVRALRLGLNEIEKWDDGFLRDVDMIDSLGLDGNKIRCPDGDFGEIFKANVTNLGLNPLDSDCKKKIEEWNKANRSLGKKVCITPTCD